MVNPLAVPDPGQKKRPYRILPPESKRPINPITKKPMSDTEMYAIRQTEKMEVPILPQERLSELRKHVSDIQAEMKGLQNRIQLLPEENPLRRQAQMRLTALKENLAKSNAELKTEEGEAEKKAISGELKRTRAMIEQMGTELTARIRATEEKVKGTPAEIEKAVTESKAIMQRLGEIERKFDEAMKRTTAPEPEEVEVAVVEETGEKPPEEFSITPKFSPLTGRLTGFIVADPEGHTATKLERYYQAILQEYKKETDPTALQNADINYTEYRVTIVLPQKRETPKQWWTLPTAGGDISVSEYYEPSATDISRYWKIYHSTDVHADKGFLQMKADMIDYARRMGWSPKPARAANLDRYLYAYYQAQAPKLKDWFFRTVYEVSE
jgi:hypothetical protein